MYILKLKCSISLKKIGELLGGRDHTTVMHGIQVIKDDLTLTAYRYQTNEQIKSVIELL